MYAGKPEVEEEFDMMEISGLNVYVDKTAPVSDKGLEVYLKGFGNFKRLVVDGFVLY